jgi:hypothetical protein
LRFSDGSSPGSSRLFRTPGQQVIALYFAIAYLVPAIGTALFRDELMSDFFFYEPTVAAFLLPSVTFCLCIVLASRRWWLKRIRPKNRFGRVLIRLERLYAGIRLPFALGALSLTAFYFSTGLNAYRYNEVGISESESPLLIVTNVVNAMLMVDVLRTVFMLPSPRTRLLTRRFYEDLLISIALLLSASGALSVFVGLVGVGNALVPHVCRELLFVRPGRPFAVRLKSFAGSILVVVLVLFPASWLIGEGIKASSAGQDEVFSGALQAAERTIGDENWLRTYALYLLDRSSVYYYSVRLTATQPNTEVATGGVPLWRVPLETLAFRADYLLGRPLKLDRPDIPSIMRLNYFLLSEDAARHPRGGSAPGVIAAFRYMFPSWLTILLGALYLSWLAQVIDVMLWRQHGYSLSIVGAGVLLIGLEQFLQSPFDLFMLIDGSVINVTLIYWIYRTSLAHLKEGGENVAREDRERRRSLAVPRRALVAIPQLTPQMWTESR